MQKSFRIVSVERVKKALALALVHGVFAYSLPAQSTTGTWTATDPGPGGVVIAGNVIVPYTGGIPVIPTDANSSPVVVGGPIVTTPTTINVTAPPNLDSYETIQPTPGGPEWLITDQPAPQGLTVSMTQKGVLKSPIASMVLDASVGLYDATVGAEMGCSVTQLYSGKTLTGQQIFCPLISKIKPVTFSFGSEMGSTCMGAPIENSTEGMDIVAAAGGLCLLRPADSYSSYFFQCGIATDLETNQTFCDGATVKFPMMLRDSSSNKSQRSFSDPVTFEVQNAERTINASFTTTLGKVAAVTNPEKLGWIKVKKQQHSSSGSGNTCLSTSGVSLMALFNTCHESKDVEIAEVIMVNVATLVVGSFAGPALDGATAIIRGSSALRFLALDGDEVETGAYGVFLE